MREASRRLNINYYSAKTVMETYKKEGRIFKKTTRDHKKPRVPQFCVYPPPLMNLAANGIINSALFSRAPDSAQAFVPPKLTSASAVQGVSERAGLSLMETAGADPTKLVLQFSFKQYSQQISETYMRNHEEQLQRALKISQRTLPAP